MIEKHDAETARAWISNALERGVEPKELHSLIDLEVSLCFKRLSAAVKFERMRADENEVKLQESEKKALDLKNRIAAFKLSIEEATQDTPE